MESETPNNTSDTNASVGSHIIDWDSPDTISLGISLLPAEERDATLNELADISSRPIAQLDPDTERVRYNRTQYATPEQERLMESGAYTADTHRALILQDAIAHADSANLRGRTVNQLIDYYRDKYGFHGEATLVRGADGDPKQALDNYWRSIGEEVHTLLNTDYIKTAADLHSKHPNAYLDNKQYRALIRAQDLELMELRARLRDMGKPDDLDDTERQEYLDLKDEIDRRSKINEANRERIRCELNIRIGQAIRDDDAAHAGTEREPYERYAAQLDIAEKITNEQFQEIADAVQRDSKAELDFMRRRDAHDRAFFRLHAERDAANAKQKETNRLLREQGEAAAAAQKRQDSIAKTIRDRERQLDIEESIPEATRAAQAARREAISTQQETERTQAEIDARQRDPETYRELDLRKQQLKTLRDANKPIKDPVPYKEGQNTRVITGAYTGKKYNSEEYNNETLYLMPRAEYAKLTKDLGIKQGAPIYAHCGEGKTYKVIAADVSIPCLNKKAFIRHYGRSAKSKQKPTQATWESRFSGTPISVSFTTTH